MASALGLLAKPYHLVARIMQNLGAVSTTATLVLAATSVWEACPTGSWPWPAPQLEAFVKKVADKFSGPDLESKQTAMLAALHEAITQATQHRFNKWAGVAVTVASAFMDMGSTKDASLFHKGLLVLTISLTVRSASERGPACSQTHRGQRPCMVPTGRHPTPDSPSLSLVPIPARAAASGPRGLSPCSPAANGPPAWSAAARGTCCNIRPTHTRPRPLGPLRSLSGVLPVAPGASGRNPRSTNADVRARD